MPVLKSFLRNALSRVYSLRAWISFRRNDVPSGVAAFHRALDLCDDARLDLLNRVGPKPDPSRQGELRRSGEAYLVQEKEDAASASLAAAIALSGRFTEQRRIDQILAPVAEDDNLIITQVAYNYFPIFELWYRNMRRLGITNILLIALDPLTAQRAEEMGIAHYYLPIFGFQKSVRRLIWSETLKVRQNILAAGVNYLHSDADAIWLQDVRPMVFSQESDFVTSIAGGTPKSALDKWGFVMCLGFYACRSNPQTRALYPHYIEKSTALGHDQNGLNQIFIDHGMAWAESADGFLRTESATLGISATALPETCVARPKTPTHDLETGVMHPVLSAKTIMGKLDLLRQCNIDFEGYKPFDTWKDS